MNGVVRATLIVIGVLLAAFCALCVAIGVGNILTQGRAELGTNIGVTIFFALGVAGGAALAWTQYRRGHESRPSKQGQLDQQLLTIAAHGDGCLTVAEVSLRTGLPLEESRAALSRLNRAGVAEPELRDDGELVYRVRGVHELTR